MYMKEASYTMEKVNDEYKLKEVVDGVAQFVGDSISSIVSGEIVGSWREPIEINNINIKGVELPMKNPTDDRIDINHKSLKSINSVINYLDEEVSFSDYLSGAENLTYVRKINTSNCSIFSKMFFNCKNIETIPTLDFRKSQKRDMDFSDIFKGCEKLKNINILNLASNCFSRTQSEDLSFSSCLYLSDNSIIKLLQEIVIMHDDARKKTRKLIFNKNKESFFNNTYCKIVENSGKYPIVLVDKNEKGAKTLLDYASKTKEVSIIFEEND